MRLNTYSIQIGSTFKNANLCLRKINSMMSRKRKHSYKATINQRILTTFYPFILFKIFTILTVRITIQYNKDNLSQYFNLISYISHKLLIAFHMAKYLNYWMESYQDIILFI